MIEYVDGKKDVIDDPYVIDQLSGLLSYCDHVDQEEINQILNEMDW